jgi:hypothetical protein
MVRLFAGAGLVVSLVLVVATLVGIPESVPDVVIVLLGLGATIVWVRVLAWMLLHRGEMTGAWGPWEPVRVRMSPYARVGIAVALGLLFLTALTSLSGLRGDPFAQDGLYYLNVHGSLIQIDHAEYLYAVRTQARGAASVIGCFYVAGFAVETARRAGRRPPKDERSA